MPKQGQSVESCIVTEFKKKVGDKVAVGDVLFSYETDKASFDEDAKVEGTVIACFFNDNDEIPCLTNVMVIGEPGESFSEYAPSGTGASAASGAEPTSPATEPANAVAEPVALQGSPAIEVTAAATPGASASPATGTVIANAPVSPRARKLAAEKGVDTAQVAGTGPHGRIIERDIIAAQGAPKSGLAKAMMADGGLQAPAAGSGIGGMVKGSDLKVWKPTHTENLAGEGEEFKVEKMSNMPLRKKAKKALEEGRIDANITINDFVCYAVIKALKKFPKVNSHCLGDAMRLFNVVNLGCAVDTERGLMVPCVKRAEDLNIVGLSKALKRVAEDCKKGSINPDLLSAEGASFTVSNLGGFGVEWFTPVINVPQSAILGVGTIVPRPKDLGAGVYAFVPYLGLSLTYDHRALDGGEATRFLKQVAVEIENLEVEF